MNIRLLFFGATAEIANSRSTQIEIQDNATVGDIVGEIIHSHPELSRHRLLFSVNQEYVSSADVIFDGDELAIFTAVSGG